MDRKVTTDSVPIDRTGPSLFANDRYVSGLPAASKWKRACGLAVVAIACMHLPWFCFAQNNPTPTQAPATTTHISALSSIELWLAYAIILFGFIVLCMQFILLRRA